MKATRIVLVNNSRESFGKAVSGAIATCLWELSRAASRAGKSPTVITRLREEEPRAWTDLVVVPPEHRGHDLLEKFHRRFTGWERINQRTYAHRVLRHLRGIRPEVVVCNNDPQVAVFLAKKLPTTRVVHWFHNLEVAPDRWRRAFARSKVDSYAVSEYLARAVESLYVMTPGSVRTVYNGVDVETFARPNRAENNPLVIGYVGRIAVEKAPDVLLTACIDLAAVRQDFAIQMIGDTNWGASVKGSYRDYVDDLVETLRNLHIRVDRIGHLNRDELPEQAGQADIFVFPSRWDEPFGLVIAEAMAAGLPILASAVGGVPEVVGHSSLLFPRDDAARLSTLISRLLDEPDLRADLSHRSQNRAAELNWDRAWSEFVSFWDL